MASHHSHYKHQFTDRQHTVLCRHLQCIIAYKMNSHHSYRKHQFTDRQYTVLSSHLQRIIAYKMDLHHSHCKHQFTDRQQTVFTTYHSLQNGPALLTHTANTILLTDSIQYLPRITAYKMDSHRSHCKHQFTDRQHTVFTTYHSLQNGLTPLTLQTPVY